MKKITRALLSVSDKTGIVEFARFLTDCQVEILSTGGTAELLVREGIAVTEVGDYTGFPEIMNGRVKTLHPKVHGGILGRRGMDDDVMAEHGIDPIDLVVVNLYPFEKTISNHDCTLEQAIENIDIGGPTMLRAAAKNHASVTVIVDSLDYDQVQQEMKDHDGQVSNQYRFKLALKVFERTANYDSAISAYLSTQLDSEQGMFPQTLNLRYSQKQIMRYGENPHQKAAFYMQDSIDPKFSENGVSAAIQVQGKELSYNNISDTDAAIECVKQFADQIACVIVKHANPCGVAVARNVLEAYQQAYSTDTESAFGGIIAFNSELNEVTAKLITDNQFVEVIVAPSISNEAKGVLSNKKNIRVFELPRMAEVNDFYGTDCTSYLDYKKVNGGLLVQESDMFLYHNLNVVSRRAPSSEEMEDLVFAMKVAKFVKSNAIVYVKNGMTIGVGAGQMSRVNSARIAAIKAEHAHLQVAGSVMASDAFFPFRDGLESAAEVGIRAVIQPGGSMRDDEVIAAADEHDIAMVFTGMRHFRH